MRKKISLLVLVFCFALVAPFAQVNAAPASALTEVRMLGVKAPNYAGWVMPNGYAIDSKYTFRGAYLEVSVRYTGYPNDNTTYLIINGSRYMAKKFWYEEQSFPSRGIVRGFEKHYRIPASYLSSTNYIQVSSTGLNGGSANGTITNIKFSK